MGGYRKIKGQGSIHAGVFWAERVLGLSLGLAIPAVFGVWLDSKFNISPVCTVIGALLGFVLLMTQLIQMVTPDKPADESPSESGEG